MNSGEHVQRRSAVIGVMTAALLASPGCTAGHVQPAGSASGQSETYDVVIHNGRVMDPESGLDAVRNIGVTGGVVRTIGTEPLTGRADIDATGLVVAPGFIDVVFEMPRMYQHLQLLDGVTTALGLWVGTDDVDRWYAEREGRAVTNFGVAVGHERVRRVVMRDPGRPGAPGDAMHRAATDGELAEIRRAIERGLARGALAVSLTNVTPGASGWETLEMFRAASGAGAVVWAPPRETGNWDADDMPRYLTELIGAAAVTGAELCIVHIQASGGPHTLRLLRIVEEARVRGVTVTAEVFPYTANLSHIGVFSDWQRWPDSAFRDLEWMATGERLTRETFARYREQDAFVIIHNEYLEPIVSDAVGSPLTLVVSGAYLDERGRGHPRASGTHARVLGHYVRERRVLSMMEALRKMSLMPARLLEGRTPRFKRKGRLREGADADLVVFDPGRIIDRATFQEPARPSEGVRHLLIEGVVVVRDGVVQEGVRPGHPIRAGDAR